MSDISIAKYHARCTNCGSTHDCVGAAGLTGAVKYCPHCSLPITPWRLFWHATGMGLICDAVMRACSKKYLASPPQSCYTHDFNDHGAGL